MGAARCKIFKRASNLSVPLVNDMGAPLVDGKVESPHRTAKRSTRPRTGWLLAALIAAVICAGTLDGPSDLDTMQAVADDHAAVQQARLVLP